MNPLLVIAAPLVLVIVGMILNNIGLSFDQPESSPEQDPAKKLAAERQAYRTFFPLQKSRSLEVEEGAVSLPFGCQFLSRILLRRTLRLVK